MASGPFTKQVPFLAGKLNSYTGDAVVGGQITAVPSGLTINAGQSMRPGDRLIFGATEILAWADSTIGTSLYEGLYIYVRTKANSTLTPTLGHLAFWDSAATDSLVQVTPDESGSEGVALRAGVFVSTLTKGNAWFVQAAGKCNVAFTTPLSGIPSDGSPVFASGDGAGTADVLDGGGSPSFTQVGQMINRYMGVALSAPAAGGTSVVELAFGGILRF